MKMSFTLYKDHAGHWRWRLMAANNRVIADSSEGYINKEDCLAGVSVAPSAFLTASYVS